MSKINKQIALICDLDNTLYDWVAYFVPSLYAMIDRALEVTNCSRDQLLDDLREVHQRHHNSEHPFALLEARCIQTWLKTGDKDQKLAELDSAFHSFNSTRNVTLRLYSGVAETLAQLANLGVKLVAHSDSNFYAVVDRLQRLEVSQFFDRIYCTEATKSNHPKSRAYSQRFSNFPFHKIVEHPRSQKKPNSVILNNIIKDENLSLSNTAYIGDSLSKDVYMAKRAGAFAIWASYGVVSNEPLYGKLVRISHWTEEDVSCERKINNLASSVTPDYTCHDSFIEVLDPVRRLIAGNVKCLP